MMGQQELRQHQSWLSLVAETAGVSGATVKRVDVYGEGVSAGLSGAWVQAIIQVLNDFGEVVGAARWEGDARELASGVTIDVPCDLGAEAGSRVVGWIQPNSDLVDPARAIPAWDAAGHFFNPAQAMKLMLRFPARRTISARRMTPSVAA